MNIQTALIPSTPYIGQPLHDSRRGRSGWIYSIEPANENIMVFGSNGLAPTGEQLGIIWDNGTIDNQTTSDAIDDWVEGLHDMRTKSIESMALLIEDAKKKDIIRTAEYLAYTEESKRVYDSFIAEYADKVPAGSKAVIIANLISNQSDLQSDYHGSTTTKTIILGFSKHNRDLFPELRKACAGVEEVQHLAIKPEKPEDANEYWTPTDEHREKYSMGHGFYLKDSYQHSDGWEVTKVSLDPENPSKGLPVGRWEAGRTVAAVAKKSTASESISTNLIDALATVEHEKREGTKAGFIEILFDGKPAQSVIDALKAERFRWSRFNKCWYGKGELIADGQTPAAPREPDTTPNEAQGIKFRAMADKLQHDIDNKMGPRQENTAKRQAEAARARQEGARLARTQMVLNNLAAMYDAGTVPAELSSLKSKKSIYELMSSKTEHVSNGFYGYLIDTDEPRNDEPLTLAVWAMLKPKTDEERKAETLAQSIRELQGSKIAGYFPTPKKVIDLMVDHVNIKQTDRILEPSLGSGSIADAVAPLCHEVKGFEVNYTLAEICDQKEYLIERRDFLTVKLGDITSYDKILMNPPFENLQDCEHVKHAYQFLKEGGTLAAIMSPSYTFNSTSKAESFRNWLSTVSYHDEELPAGSFKDSGTGVNTRLLVIYK
mgnify:FL=1